MSRTIALLLASLSLSLAPSAFSQEGTCEYHWNRHRFHWRRHSRRDC